MASEFKENDNVEMLNLPICKEFKSDLGEQLQNLEKSALQNKGSFSSNSVFWAYNLNSHSINTANWKNLPLKITDKGQLIASNSTIIISNLQGCGIELYDQLAIKLIIGNQKTIFLKLLNYKEYNDLLASLIMWKNMKPSGILSKWNYNDSIIYNSQLTPNDVIVCRFKVYGPVPTEIKKFKIFNEPENPIYPTSPDSTVKEGWFMAIGHLMPNGILNILCESDGSLLFSVNIFTLFSSEIRILHHSLLQNANVIFLGFIDGLRNNKDQSLKYISGEEKRLIDKYPTVNRILIDFDLGIDLEDWFVALTSFTKLEYIGNPFTHLKLRIKKFCNLEIMEAQFNKVSIDSNNKYLYCELVLWNTPWLRSAVVETDSENSVFWKEQVEFDFPYSMEYFKLLIKSSKDSEVHNVDGENTDEIVGTCFITPDLFLKDQFLKRIPICDLQSKNIGNLMINLTLVETKILPWQTYRFFEQNLLHFSIDELISWINPQLTTSNLENWAMMLLDIYMALGKEDQYLNSLLLNELKPLDGITKVSKPGRSFNTIFRGNSMLSKSLEKYTLRVGQEYLEKLLGPWIKKVQLENLDCECDPRQIVSDTNANYKNLLNYCKELWSRIYDTSNDIPDEIKNQWKNLRNNVELSIDPSDSETPLNALSAFIFLRFLCPPILNPKLFNLTKSHQSGKVNRTLILVAKVLMTFSNRTMFQKHKEPYLLKLNDDFLKPHQEEILMYFDKVTQRKMDFKERLLDMSGGMDRLKLNTSGEILNELPTMPFLIDKYWRIQVLIELLAADKNYAATPTSATFPRPQNLKRNQSSGSNWSSEYLSIPQHDSFLQSALDDSDDEFNKLLINSNTNLEDLIREARALVLRNRETVNLVENAEIPQMFDWEPFVQITMNSLWLAQERNVKSLEINSKILHNVKFQHLHLKELTKVESYLQFQLSESRNPANKFVVSDSGKMLNGASTTNMTNVSSKLNSNSVDSESNLKNRRKSSIFGKIFRKK